MKKLIATILTVSAFTYCCTQINTDKKSSPDTEKLYHIDKIERDCVAKNYTTTGMTNCGYEAMELWFKEIDKYLELLKNVTSKNDYENILKSQSKWKEYQEAEFEAISVLTNKQGTIFQNILIGKKRGLVKQRALDLKNLYNDLID